MIIARAPASLPLRWRPDRPPDPRCGPYPRPYPQTTGTIRPMRLCRGASAVLLIAALAIIASLALPAAGQPAQTTTSSTSGAGTATTGFGSAVPTTTLAPGSGGGVSAPGGGAVLILVRRLTWRQAAAAARGRSETIAAGLISTLPGDASLAARVLSLAAGRQVDAAALAGGTDRAAI